MSDTGAARSSTPPLSGGTPWCVTRFFPLSPGLWTLNKPVGQREAVYKHFRFNNRTARQSFLGMVAFPVAVFALAYNQDVCFFLLFDTSHSEYPP